jgi:hypothetical protein
MKRLRRIIINGLPVLLALMSVLTAIMWLHSYVRLGWISLRGPDCVYEVITRRGEVVLQFARVPGGPIKNWRVHRGWEIGDRAELGAIDPDTDSFWTRCGILGVETRIPWDLDPTQGPRLVAASIAGCLP